MVIVAQFSVDGSLMDGLGRSGVRPVRHFLVDKDLFGLVMARVVDNRTSISFVINNILRHFGGGMSQDLPAVSGGIPEVVAVALCRVADSGSSVALSGYLVALTDAGWSMAALAAVLPQRRVVLRKTAAGARVVQERMASPTRQAVQLRVKQAREIGFVCPAGLPVPVAPAGPVVRRAAKGSGGNKKDCMVRVSDYDYDLAVLRAQHESLSMAVVVRRGLLAYLDVAAG